MTEEQKEMLLKNFVNNLFSDHLSIVDLGLFCTKDYGFQDEVKILFNQRFDKWIHDVYLKKRTKNKSDFKRLLKVKEQLEQLNK